MTEVHDDHPEAYPSHETPSRDIDPTISVAATGVPPSNYQHTAGPRLNPFNKYNDPPPIVVSMPQLTPGEWAYLEGETKKKDAKANRKLILISVVATLGIALLLLFVFLYQP